MTLIRAKNLTKAYSREAPLKRLGHAWRNTSGLDAFFALSQVSFTLARGETLGVLGVNGAGKSTLLKLLAGVTSPTSGELAVTANTGALLELGSAFNPQLSGIENARMTLRLAGLAGEQAAEQLQAALDFADIGEFVSRPVKTYSSGMFVRLAFACATAARPDLLLVDEALSVGDLAFQAKCIKRMKDMLAQGVGLVFVSHDLGAVKAVCQRCLLLDGGRAVALGPTEEVARRYFERKIASEGAAPPPPAQEGEEVGDGRVRFTSVALLDGRGQPKDSFAYGETVTLKMELEVYGDVPALCLGYHIQNSAGVDAVYSDSAVEQTELTRLKKGERLTASWTFDLALAEGSHNIAAVCSLPVDISLGQVQFLHYLHTAAQFFMERRPGAKLYGLCHWPNKLEVTRG